MPNIIWICAVLKALEHFEVRCPQEQEEQEEEEEEQEK